MGPKPPPGARLVNAHNFKTYRIKNMSNILLQPTTSSSSLDPYRFEGQDDEQDDGYARQLEADQAAAKAAIAVIASAASGEIPQGWTYAGPVKSTPTRQESRVGVKPRIIGALVRRPAIIGDRSGEERASLIAGSLGEIQFIESWDSKSVRADVWINEIRAFISAFADITVRDTGSNTASEYTVYAGKTAVLRCSGFSWPLDELAKSRGAVTGAEFAPNVGGAGVWVRI